MSHLKNIVQQMKNYSKSVIENKGNFNERHVVALIHHGNT